MRSAMDKSKNEKSQSDRDKQTEANMQRLKQRPVNCAKKLARTLTMEEGAALATVVSSQKLCVTD